MTRSTTADLARSYLDQAGRVSVEDHAGEFEGLLTRLAKFVPLTRDTRILEVGVGTGWFEVACAQRGLSCRGLEPHPEFVDYALKLGRSYGFELEIEQGSVEDHPLGNEKYDLVLALSVFEHVRNYRRSLENVYRALKPGGVFYFYSTNRFALRSGEYPGVPFYGWLPDPLRYRFRIWRQGPQIVESAGIDFNQFTHWQLRRLFEEIGFRRVLDRTQLISRAEDLVQPARWKELAVAAEQRSPAVRLLARTFASGNTFVCVK